MKKTVEVLRKLHGSYEALKYGTALDGLADLTGGAAENLKLSQVGSLMNVSKIGINAGAVVPATAQLVAHLLGMTSVVTAVVEQDPNVAKGHQETLPNGIIVGVNYRVCTVQKVEKYDGDFVQLVLLALPSVPEDTGQTQHMNNNLDYDILYDGLWSRGSTTWNDVPTEEQERIGLGALAPEEFWMSLPDFVKTFTHLEMVHLDHETSKDEETLNGCRAWQMRSHHAVWQKGVTAGGCRNNTETFHLNPQMLLGVAERQEVVVSVSQHAILEPKVVGFSLYRLTNSNQTDDSVPHQKYVACTRDYFRRHKSFFNSEYTNSRQVSARVVLEAGHYVILPTTFEPGEEASFTLRVYSAKLFKLRVLDTPSALVKPIIVKAPAMMNGGTFSQYEAVFLQLADEHMTVNAFELQELLDACLPNDYVKSCASLDVCRQVVIALDRDGRGRLKFADFKDFLVSLKSWQGAFRAHTKEKMGILRAERLKDALQHVGYQLSREILSVIAMRYTRKDGTLRFGDFVSAVLKLSMAFGLFERRQLTQPNTLNIRQDEWLKMVLMC
ncbi:unnamed protein product [Notodromas monacha]|uniref:Uncharacterized protein n=1 Tax=Notodromas monacha TaxID=399045 RepID=A0A7R9BYL5_9CRUS|nr:unnamed protein product [Notodromas monacha]CAG0922996.1 unnamed protein product [Notodromas monacha]